MEKKWTKTVIQVAVCVVLLCLIWGGYFVVIRNLNQRVELYEDDFSWVYQVDAVEQNGRNVELTGFAFKLDTNSKEGTFEIVLRDIDTEELYFPEMKYEKRTDVNEYFLCEYDYLNSGFIATIKAKKLGLEEKDYEVLLKMKGEKKTYQTGTYISKGELMYVNPKEYVPLEVAGTDLEPIVENGVLRVYRPDYGMYVYQYEGELYWIAESTYGFVEGDTFVQCNVDTTQISRLPERRLEKQLFWGNIGFWFCKRELFEENFEDYRVAKRALPIEYSVEKIWTGNYIDEWIWRQYFRPYYQFN